MTVLRTFIACEVPVDLQDSIHEAIQPLRRSVGSELVRWVPAHNVHLTLKFLGDVPPAAVDLIQRTMATEAARCQPCDARVEDLGAFPSLQRPSVLWIGLRAPPTLGTLQHQLNVATERLGYKGEEREFAPHLTVGRFRNSGPAADIQRLAHDLRRLGVGYLGLLHVGAVHLFKSDLQRTGPVYTKLYSAPLGNAQ